MARELLGLKEPPKTLDEAGVPRPAGEREIVRRQGRVLEVRAARSADIFPAGRLSIILQDKTRDYALLEELASKEALASLGQASATLAHEIRNPLTAIQSALDCITQDAESGRLPKERHAELVREEMRRLNDLLERSLQLSRPLELNREPCDLNGLLRKTIDRMPPMNGTRLEQDLAPDLPRVSADPDLVFQLFANLLRNAVEASHEIRVSTRHEEGRATIRVFSASARIPSEVEAKLFHPFVTSKARGTGLGLAFCRKITTAHDAQIDGRNVEGGVLFEVRFPA
jgi:signal transduction histidine kinase